MPANRHVLSAALPLILFLLVSIAGCDSRATGGSGMISELTTAQWMEQQGWQPVTEEEATRFGEQLEEAIANRRRSDFTRCANFNKMVRFSASGLLSGRELEAFAKGATQAESTLFDALAAPGSSYKLIGVKTWDEGYGALMRLVDPQSACNFAAIWTPRSSID